MFKFHCTPQMLQVNSPTSSEQDHAVSWKALKLSTKPFPSMPNDPIYSASSIYCFGYHQILKTLYFDALLILRTLEVPIQISYRVDSESQDQIQGLWLTYIPLNVSNTSHLLAHSYHECVKA